MNIEYICIYAKFSLLVPNNLNRSVDFERGLSSVINRSTTIVCHCKLAGYKVAEPRSRAPCLFPLPFLLFCPWTRSSRLDHVQRQSSYRAGYQPDPRQEPHPSNRLYPASTGRWQYYQHPRTGRQRCTFRQIQILSVFSGLRTGY